MDEPHLEAKIVRQSLLGASFLLLLQTKEAFIDVVLRTGEFLIYYLIYNISSAAVNAFTTSTIDELQEKMLARLKELQLVFLTSALTLIGKMYFGRRIMGTTDMVCFSLAMCLLAFFDPVKLAAETKIGYGAGMACNFFEGYLNYILPDPGQAFRGIGEAMEKYEEKHQVNVPVKRLFLIFTKTNYYPPDLKQFNKEGKPPLEPASPLEALQKDVAGVKDRIYKNSVYKIHKKDGTKVYVVAECPTPLLTLNQVKMKRTYKVLSHANFDEITREFEETLVQILNDSHTCKDKVEIIHYDDTNPAECLADLILERIELRSSIIFK